MKSLPTTSGPGMPPAKSNDPKTHASHAPEGEPHFADPNSGPFAAVAFLTLLLLLLGATTMHAEALNQTVAQPKPLSSTAISSPELEVKGKGIINDNIHRQNPLVRFIEKVLVF